MLMVKKMSGESIEQRLLQNRHPNVNSMLIFPFCTGGGWPKL